MNKTIFEQMGGTYTMQGGSVKEFSQKGLQTLM